MANRKKSQRPGISRNGNTTASSTRRRPDLTVVADSLQVFEDKPGGKTIDRKFETPRHSKLILLRHQMDTWMEVARTLSHAKKARILQYLREARNCLVSES